MPWRMRDGSLEVALVHRPRYDDWSWPKGKLDPGEDWPVAAARETLEETGLRVRLGQPLPTAMYAVFTLVGPREKVVAYWTAEVTGGPGRLENEIDEVAWLPVPAADARLDYARDRDQLRALVRAHQGARLATWPLALVRHAVAVPRSAFKGRDDRLRPLTPAGHRRAAAIAPVLAAYGITSVVTSPSVRCTQTVAPYAGRPHVVVRGKDGLSEEGYAKDPDKAAAHLVRMLERAEPVALCTHGPLLPRMVDTLAGRLDVDSPNAEMAATALRAAREDRLVKGEVLVAHLRGQGAEATVVAVERHLPDSGR